jgi:chromosome segregation ATPase
LFRRRELWKREQEAKEALDAAKDKFARAKKAFSNSISPDLANGLDSLNLIVQEMGIEGVHGSLIDLVTCQRDNWIKAVEVRLQLE